MAPGESPAPFVVVGHRIRALRMWQSKGWSFAVGLVLAAGSSIAVAETANQAAQSLALPLAEFAKQANEAAPVRVSVAPLPESQAQVSGREEYSAPPAPAVQQTGERQVLSFSLVKFVEQAAAEGEAGAVPRVSLVDLVSETPPAATAAVIPARAEPVAPAEQVVAQPAPVAAPAPAPLVATAVPEPRVPEVASSVRLMPPPQTSSNSAERPSLILPPRPSSDVPALQDSVSFERPELQAELNGNAGELQLFDAVRQALQQHPVIAESLSRLDAQQEQVGVARAGYWPQLRTGINSGYRHTTGRSEEALTVSASQMIYDFGKVSSAVEAAESSVDREEAAVLMTAEDLVRDTAQAFIEARRFEVLLELATEQIDAIADLEELAAKRSALGASTVSDEMQAKSRREAARATQLQMQAQRDQWHRALEKLIGSRQRVTLDDSYPESLAGVCHRLPENFDNAPRVVIAEAERAEAEAVIRQARAEQRPTVSLSADFEHYLDRDTGGFQQLDDQEFVVRLNLTSNLFQGGALRARSRAADHALYSATAAKDRALLELSRLYRETRDRSLSLTSSLALQDERYDSIARTQELYRHQYLSLGTRTLLDILNTEQEIFQTQVDKQNTLFDLRNLQINCLYSVGGLRDAFRAGDAMERRVANRRVEVGS